MKNTVVTSFRISEAQRAKLRKMATMLNTSSNAVLCQLIDNAHLETVERVVPMAKLELPDA